MAGRKENAHGAGPRKKAEIYVGTSGWSYPDWEGVVYPPPAAGGALGGQSGKLNELAYMAQFFDCVEINNTFYRPPPAAYCHKWLRDVAANPSFSFTLKLWQRFTHEREQMWEAGDVNAFQSGIQPLVEANRLGAVLVQFPWGFFRTPENTEWLWRIADDFSALPLVIELRHISWKRDDFFALLNERKLNFCNIDQPYTRSSIEPTSIATGPVAYYRFHGRNRDKWFSKDAGRDERYDYLYSEKELAPWIEKIAAMAEKVERIYVMANNHYRGQAPANALQIKAALSGERVAVPETLLQHYPFLGAIAGGEGRG